MKNKKIILILSIAILVLIFSSFLFYLNSRKIGSDVLITSNITKKIENKKIYSDNEYGFKFNYQNSLSYVVANDKKVQLPDYLIKSEQNQNNYEIVDRYISFKYNLGPGVLSINIYKNTKYKNIEDWLNDYVKNQPNEIIVFRENNGISIDDNKTIITHIAGLDQNKKYVFEDYPYEKTIGFIKDSNLFVINIKENIGDQSYIEFLKSFRFTK